MSGHSKWSTIKHKKGAADAKRGKLFGRLIREITVAAKIGGDIDSNPRLRSAVSNAKSSNMPNKNIEGAIAKGIGGGDGANYDEIVFEGYGAGGVALVVECLTDNRNRTVAEVRHVFTKAGSKLGNENSVRWMFQSKGIISVLKDAGEEDAIMDMVLEAGADDFFDEGDYFEIITSMEVFEAVTKTLEDAGIKTERAEIAKIPENYIAVSGDDVQKLLKLVNALDDLDDTQSVYGNFDISDEDMQAFEG